MVELKKSNILIVGLVRNCEKKIENSLFKIEESLKKALSIRFYIIESDSNDNTLSILSKISNKKNNFTYVSLGCLKTKYPKRTQRLAYCRNYYLDYINYNSENEKIDYVVVADLDGVNDGISSNAIESCWNRIDWDVCTANQHGPYYDVWTLRHSTWSPNDCSNQFNFLRSKGVNLFRSSLYSLYSRMIVLSPSENWIEVDSSFGGFAIYKKKILLNTKYVGLNDEGEEISDHVSVNKQIRSAGGRIFINPTLINSGVVEHSFYATKIGLIIFWFRCCIRSILCYLQLLPIIKKLKKL